MEDLNKGEAEPLTADPDTFSPNKYLTRHTSGSLAIPIHNVMEG